MNAYEQMRAALMQVSLSCSACPRHNCKGCTRPFASFMPTVRKALTLPRRQCDMGTPEEQAERYNAFCRKHFTPDKLGGNCRKCPLRNRRGWSCQLAWAQMPYEEKGRAKK